MTPRTKISSALAALLLGTSVQAFAASGCQETNLLDSRAGILDSIPIYDQSETNLCYAYSAAQLAEFELRDRLELLPSDATHLQALWTAMSYKGSHSAGIRFRTQNLGQGYLPTAMKDLISAGSCDGEAFQKGLARWMGSTPYSQAEFTYLYESFWEERSSLKSNAFGAVLTRLMADPDFRRVVTGSDDPASALPASTLKELRRIHAQVASAPRAAVIAGSKVRHLLRTYFKECQSARRSLAALPALKAIGSGYAKNPKLAGFIEQVLGGPAPRPVAVGYCSKIYSDDAAEAEAAGRRTEWAPRISRVVANGSCSAHYSLIIGQRPGPAGCQYLVRNTAGTTRWTHRYACECRTSAGASGHADCDLIPGPESSKQVLGCWLDEAPLLNSVYDLAAFAR